MLGYVVLGRVSRMLIADTVAGLTTNAVVATLGSLIIIAAAALLILIIRQIGAWQSGWLAAVPAGLTKDA